MVPPSEAHPIKRELAQTVSELSRQHMNPGAEKAATIHFGMLHHRQCCVGICRSTDFDNFLTRCFGNLDWRNRVLHRINHFERRFARAINAHHPVQPVTATPKTGDQPGIRKIGDVFSNEYRSIVECFVDRRCLQHRVDLRVEIADIISEPVQSGPEVFQRIFPASIVVVHRYVLGLRQLQKSLQIAAINLFACSRVDIQTIDGPDGLADQHGAAFGIKRGISREQ